MPLAPEAIERLCRRFMGELDPGAPVSATAAAGRELALLVQGRDGSRPAAPPLPAPIFRAAPLAAANGG
jgi:hypothetical protein